MYLSLANNNISTNKLFENLLSMNKLQSGFVLSSNINLLAHFKYNLPSGFKLYCHKLNAFWHLSLGFDAT